MRNISRCGFFAPQPAHVRTGCALHFLLGNAEERVLIRRDSRLKRPAYAFSESAGATLEMPPVTEPASLARSPVSPMSSRGASETGLSMCAAGDSTSSTGALV